MVCKQCGKCCSNYLPLTTEEVIRIKKLAKKENKRLLDKDWYNYCPLLNAENKCDIYDNRPSICKLFTCEKFEKHLFDIEDIRELSKGNRQLVDLRKVIYGGMQMNNINEDIEIIKKYIDENIEPFIFENLNYGELYAFREAIENLIKENIRISHYANMAELNNSRLNEKLENSISKDKIREKIDEIQKRMNDDCLVVHEIERIAKIDILKELLEEGE